MRVHPVSPATSSMCFRWPGRVVDQAVPRQSAACTYPHRSAARLVARGAEEFELRLLALDAMSIERLVSVWIYLARVNGQRADDILQDTAAAQNS